MYLDRGGKAVVGTFYFTAGTWVPIFLGGDWNNGKVLASDETEYHPATGELEGRITSGAFRGTWTQESSRKKEPVRLTVVQKPGCDGPGKWVRFAAPQWPLSFSYPASWQISVKEDEIVLTCPDPENMSYEAHLTISRGVGTPDDIAGLTQCDGHWKYHLLGVGSTPCDCGKPAWDCSDAGVSKQQGLTVLNLDEREWRMYCSEGGYIGQGEGAFRIILVKGGWVEFYAEGESDEIVDRLIGTIKERSR